MANSPKILKKDCVKMIKSIFIMALVFISLSNVVFANSIVKTTYPKNIFYEQKAINLNKSLLLDKTLILKLLNQGFTEEEIKNAYIITLIKDKEITEILETIKRLNFDQTLLNLEIEKETFIKKKNLYFKNEKFKMPRDNVFWRNIKPE